jgi:hypothetical protein
MTEAELEAQARKLANGGKDEEAPLEWGTGLKQKADAQDAQARLRAAVREVLTIATLDKYVCALIMSHFTCLFVVFRRPSHSRLRALRMTPRWARSSAPWIVLATP